MNSFLSITTHSESDSYSITVNKNIITNLKSYCNNNLIISIIVLILTILMEIELCQKLNLQKGEHSSNRLNTRNGYYKKSWNTLIGKITLDVPRLRHGSYHPFFEPTLDRLERQRKKLAVFCYIAGISTRLIKPLFHLLGFKPIDKSGVSRLNKEILYMEVKAFDKKDFSGDYFPVVMLDALYENVRIGGVCQKKAIIVVTGIDQSGYRRVLDVRVTAEECNQTYLKVLSDLKKRGLKTPDLIISDAHSGIKRAVKELFPGCLWQRCAVHRMRESLKEVTQPNRHEFYSYIYRIFNAPDFAAAQKEINLFKASFNRRENKAVRIFLKDIEDSLTFFQFPEISYHKIYSTNLHERLNRFIRNRTRGCEQFPDQSAYRRLVICWLIKFNNNWIDQAYLTPQSMDYITYQSKIRREPSNIMSIQFLKKLYFI